jgi:hypothetical protein
MVTPNDSWSGLFGSGFAGLGSTDRITANLDSGDAQVLVTDEDLRNLGDAQRWRMVFGRHERKSPSIQAPDQTGSRDDARETQR